MHEKAYIFLFFLICSPSGKKFRSKPQLARYLGNTVDLSSFDFRTGKMMPSKLQKNKQRLRNDSLNQNKVNRGTPVFEKSKHLFFFLQKGASTCLFPTHNSSCDIFLIQLSVAELYNFAQVISKQAEDVQMEMMHKWTHVHNPREQTPVLL